MKTQKLIAEFAISFRGTKIEIALHVFDPKIGRAFSTVKTITFYGSKWPQRGHYDSKKTARSFIWNGCVLSFSKDRRYR